MLDIMSVISVVTTLVWLYSFIGVEPRFQYEYPVGIVGGDHVNITEAPFMAHYRPRNVTHFCGATIIHHSFLVSAGHCHYVIEKLNTTPYITVGTDKADSGGEEYEIAHHHPHPKFTPGRVDYDIVVIQLAKPLKFISTVQAIPLAGKDFVVPEGAVFDALGFGRTSYNGPVSNELLKVSVPHVNFGKCKQMYAKFVDLSERMICAGAEGKDSCSGDSGGPLIYKDMLVGVVSFGMACGYEKYPGVYMYIPPFRGFIDSVIAKNS